ncbi:MAG: hypothetical protein R3F13_15205 [Prosthecobacter sp.]
MTDYAALNPFTATSVGENDLWNASAFRDVPNINSTPFAALKSAVDQVRERRRSQVRFVRGAGGAGKSHLFSRLHRSCADGVFYAYAPNPPLQPEALEPFILSRFVSSLRHPARRADGTEAPYSQLRLLAYALLKPVVEQEMSLAGLHEAWAGISLESQKELIHQAVQLLEAEHPMVPRSVLRCLLNVLRADKQHLAAQWLSGAAYLTDNELKFLGVTDPLARGEVGLVIQLFGKLAAQAGCPAVLVLDQLDLISTQPQFDEMQRLLFSLIDQSENWVVLIGLVAERFAMWDAALSQALRGRLGTPDTNAPLGFRLPVIDMLPIANDQKKLLLTCRLESPELAALRKKDGIASSIHPLLEEDITRLTSGGAIFPRHLLAAAAELYETRVAGKAVAPASAAVVPSAPAATSTPVTSETVKTPPVATPPVPAAKTATPAAAPVVTPPVAAPPPPAAKTATPATVPAVTPPVAKPPPSEGAAVSVVAESDDKDTDVPVAVAVTAVAAAVAAATTAKPAPAPSATPAVAKIPLAEKIDSLLQTAVDGAKAASEVPSAIDLGERVRDVIELMVAPPVTVSEGDIRKSYENFDGADRWFEWGGGKVRVVTSDSMRGSFIAVLERLKDACGDTLLLRHDVAPVSGQLTLELLNAFKSKNIFHHLPASESAVLTALGRVLASQREGSYDQLATEPPATKDNVLAALRNHPLLRGLRLWEMIQKTHAPKQAKAAVVTPPPASVLSSIARPSTVAVVKPSPFVGEKKPTEPPAAPPASPPPPTAQPVSASSPPAVKFRSSPSAPPAKSPPPPPTVASKPPVKPTPPVAKPPPGVARPPVAKLPPPSQGTAA